MNNNKKNLWIKEETFSLLNKSKAILMLNNPNLKISNDLVIKLALEKYIENERTNNPYKISSE
jgi:hypothetical protein